MKPQAPARSKPLRCAEIRSEVDGSLHRLGFAAGTWNWRPGRCAVLTIIVANGLQVVALKSGMSKRALQAELGRFLGWAEVMQLKPRSSPAVEMLAQQRRNEPAAMMMA